MPLSCPDIASACGVRIEAVVANWPRIVEALEAVGIRSDLVEVAAAATIAVETARTFNPINEFGGVAYFTKHYEFRRDLGNLRAGDGALFRGRGYIQITGRANYRAFSQVAGCDLEFDPTKALDPTVSAKILASYFASRHVAEAANGHDWRKVRRLVNGGLNGWDEFNKCVVDLLEAINE